MSTKPSVLLIWGSQVSKYLAAQCVYLHRSVHPSSFSQLTGLKNKYIYIYLRLLAVSVVFFLHYIGKDIVAKPRAAAR